MKHVQLSWLVLGILLLSGCDPLVSRAVPKNHDLGADEARQRPKESPRPTPNSSPSPTPTPSTTPTPPPTPAPPYPTPPPPPGVIKGCVPVDLNGKAAYYVSPNGNDGSSGSASAPFRTIERARDEVRTLKASGQLNRPVFVLIGKGTYTLSQTFALGAGDSGTLQFPITYMPYQCEQVVISGATRIINAWTLHSGSIYKTSVGSLRFNSLFVNGKRSVRARHPNVGSFFQPTEGGETYLKFNTGDIYPAWRNLTDVEVVVLNTWEGPRFRIANVSGNTANFQGRTGSGRRVGYWMPPRYYSENVFEKLDSPGEWYLDRNDGMLYYWPLAGENLGSATIEAPKMQTIVHVQGAQHIHFKYLTFSHGDFTLPQSGHMGFQAGASIAGGNAITFKSSNHCTFEGNTVNRVGAYAVQVDASQFIRIIGSDIFDAGAGGVKIGPTGINFGLTSMPENNITVTDNTIHDNGAVYREAIGGVWIMLGGNNTVSHNHIYNVPLGGISVGWNWGKGDTTCKNNIVRNNHIHHVMLEMNDSAGIYTLGKQPGTELSNNVIHDIVQRDHPVDTHIFGIYMDEGSSSIAIKNNLVYRTAWGIHMNATANNHITNNIIVDTNKKYPFVFYMDSGTTVNKNIVYYSTQHQTIGGAGFGAMASSNHNVIFNPNKSLNRDNLVGGWPSLFDTNSRFQDPLFKNKAADDYSLLPNSPAFGVGFVQPDLSQVGPRVPYVRQ